MFVAYSKRLRRIKDDFLGIRPYVWIAQLTTLLKTLAYVKQ